MDNSYFAYANYDEELAPIGYDEAPQYEWGPRFKFEEFERLIRGCNHDESSQLERNLQICGIEAPFSNRPLRFQNIRELGRRSWLNLSIASAKRAFFLLRS